MELIDTEVPLSQEHIENGERSQCRNCPAALAINDVLKPEYFAVVYAEIFMIFKDERSTAMFGGERKLGSYPLPEEASAFIDAFDHFDHEYISPFTFKVKLPKEIIA